MEQLWSPWRSTYIRSADERNAEGCFLCNCAAATEPNVDDLVVARYQHSVVVMNRFPYNAGHLLVAPIAHEGDLRALPPEVAHELMDVMQLSIDALDEVLQPHGCNVGANLGRHAGAGVPDHLHIHVVPRWSGDTNFMPVLADVKMISDSLEELWHQLRDAFARKGTLGRL